MTSCTFYTSRHSIGWTNAASVGVFRAWIEHRMGHGFTYLITAPPMSCEVIFNNATKINLGITMQQIHIVIREMEEDFLRSGDISIVRLSGGGRDGRTMASSSQNVLDHHTIEMPPSITQ